MQLSLLKGNDLFSLVLPDKPKGQYWMRHRNENGYEENVISVEGVGGQWIVKSNTKAYILDESNQKVKERIITSSQVYKVYLPNIDETVLLYCEPVTEDRRAFTKFKLPSNGQLIIGRAADCGIQFSNPYVSSKHMRLVIHNQQITLYNLSQSNGTYVNGRKVEQKELAPGDMLYVIGLKIIVGNGFMAINNPDGAVTIQDQQLQHFQKPSIVETEEEIEDHDASVLKTFYRSPRFKREVEKKEWKIDPPPSKENIEETPLILMLGPSLTMGMASLFTGAFAVYYAMNSGGDMMFAIPTLLMSLSMLLGTVLFPVLTRRNDRLKKEDREQLRQEKYKDYLNHIRSSIADETAYQQEIMLENAVDVEESTERIRNLASNLWERTKEQNDFLKMRLGLGDVPLALDLNYQKKKFTLEDDNLEEALYSLAEEPKRLKEVPITMSLIEDRASGMIGERQDVINLAKSMILQLTSLHSYEEVRLVFLYDKKEQEQWGFAKWLPHVWAKDEGIRFLATDANEVKEISAYMEKELAKREAMTNDDERHGVTPHYVVFAIDKQLASKAEFIKTILMQRKNYGFSVVHLYDELIRLPKECTLVVDLEDKEAKVYDKNESTGAYVTFNPEYYQKGDEQELAMQLSNIQLDSSTSDYQFPSMLTFLEMFEVGKIEHLNALTRWKENDPTITLEAPVGVDTNGELFHLDLHEKFHGPHGLVAGMTGSGKSEFIMAYIMSLAVNYHPDEVAFILIDYKGGGMAHTFSELPHVAGVITNLDGPAVKRSLISIQSELKRRQAIFNEASDRVGESNIDIYKYQKLYREGKVTEPVQHLFIISDEFAELKTQEPEFMEQLISAARIGRSLGVHLILATQKPSGVVDDQIWSNSRFRVSLKVQEKADSMDVIKRPDAAELTTTGRFYLQVGFNELFEMGQSAWGGAPYFPSERSETEKDESITVIDNLGREMKSVKLDKRQGLNINPPKQIDEITKYLSTIAAEEEIRVRQIWLDPIPALIYVDEISGKYNLPKPVKGHIQPIIGEVDHPANQEQLPMTFPLTREGNAIIYGSGGSGKTTFLTTLIYQMIENHSPNEVNMYILDYGAETLKSFEKAPHVGDVLLSGEEEKTHNLIKMLYDEIDRRKKRFADYGGDYHSYVKATKEEFPVITVFIHNYAGFAETYEAQEEAIAYLTREGTKYGIYFILTASNTGAVRFRLLQNFKQLFVLQLNDEADYSGVLGNVNGVYPTKHKGRGIFKSEHVYEFQVAHVFKDEENTLQNIRKYCDKVARKWSGTKARRVPILPDEVTASYLAEAGHQARGRILPVGIEKQSLQAGYGDFDRYINLVTGQSVEDAKFMQGLTQVIASKGDGEVLVMDPDHVYENGAREIYRYMHSSEELESVVVELFNMLVSRNNTYKDALAQGEQPPSFDQVTCMIHSLSSLIEKLSEDAKDKLQVLLEKGEKEYNVSFIICDSIEKINALSFEPWFKSKVSLSDGLWMGNGIADQFKLKIKTSNQSYQELEDGFGYIVHKGKLTLVKLVSSETSEAETFLGV
ncbi:MULTISPECIES: type VII secretion protein EssC [Pontibacillus]|uniref:Type VII secretion protein EssC n=1 Tax=Pontibacillus chungwhensis TaxID=265426 RepID=A0ABY8UX36_9BACI|nr:MULTISPECIES: type VII secretion protein EssC [Pontibacillus]MCD5324189.1 type VII secretion protein EssC [Pontibacillus sp. HN14]WIF97753.1 type VII secretion protein EssC [Pontibacillus chungwhensis]